MSFSRQKLLKVLKKFPDVNVAIIYGSIAKGTQTKKSDLDLAIAGEKIFSPDQKVDLINNVSVACGIEVDLIDLNEATGTVLKEAIRSGKVILNDRPEILAKVLSRLMFDEEDFQKSRARMMKLRRGKIFNDT